MNAIQASRVEAELNQRFTKEKNEALDELRDSLKKSLPGVTHEHCIIEYETKNYIQYHQENEKVIHQLRSDFEEAKSKLRAEMRSIAESEILQWKLKRDDLDSELKQSQITINAQQSKIKSLEALIAAHEQEQQKQNQSHQENFSRAAVTASQEKAVEMNDLRKQLTQREAEIGFLRDTVRLECEERMGFVALVEKLKKRIGALESGTVAAAAGGAGGGPAARKAGGEPSRSLGDRGANASPVKEKLGSNSTRPKSKGGPDPSSMSSRISQTNAASPRESLEFSNTPSSSRSSVASRRKDDHGSVKSRSGRKKTDHIIDMDVGGRRGTGVLGSHKSFLHSSTL
ncbi:hypothetical protein HK102_007266 [Quaeritorhiza haematococci]|nr:hypothetical protein HK102_007266 [Quaeritorhiza haematococci]